MPLPYSKGYQQAAILSVSATVPITKPKSTTTDAVGTDAFLCTVAGSVTVIMNGMRDQAAVTFPVLAGEVYEIDIAYLTAATATIMGLWV